MVVDCKGKADFDLDLVLCDVRSGFEIRLEGHCGRAEEGGAQKTERRVRIRLMDPQSIIKCDHHVEGELSLSNV